jgi:SAM-dependent methyltransferase
LKGIAVSMAYLWASKARDDRTLCGVGVARLLSSFVIRMLTIRRNQERAHRSFYNVLARIFGPAIPWHFMNYGFDSISFHEHPLQLSPKDEMDRLYVQLYDHVLSSVSVRGTMVLEVGCGRGGGASYVARYLAPRRAIGLDLCQRSIRICHTNHTAGNLTFLTGDAQHLPFRDESFDIVVNVESSHAYGSVATFLTEVRRVLRPGGFLVLADLRWHAAANGSEPPRGLPLLRRQLGESDLIVQREFDLTSGVVQARSAANADQRAAIRQHVPRGLRAAFVELGALPGSMMYRGLEERRLIYWSCVAQKPTHVM